MKRTGNVLDIAIAPEYVVSRKTRQEKFSAVTHSLKSTPSVRIAKRGPLRLGVGETTALSIFPVPRRAPRWALSGLGSLDRSVGDSVTFTAADRASMPTVSVVVDNQPLSITFDVVEPEQEVVYRMEKYPLEEEQLAGAAMELGVEILPNDVSFGNLEVREISGYPEIITGYFEDVPREQLYHEAMGWIAANVANRITDHAIVGNLRRPWRDGVVQWRIPVRWRVKGSIYEGSLPDALMKATMYSDIGAVKIEKWNAESTVRAPGYRNTAD